MRTFFILAGTVGQIVPVFFILKTFLTLIFRKHA